MSTTTAAPAGAPGAGGAPAPGPAPRAVAGETCPLCGAPLHPEQEWCLNCGAAARTRLAASPNWRAPLVAAALVAVLSFGVLAVALVKLAGGSGQERPASTRTVTTLSSAPAAAPTATAATATVPTTSTTPLPTLSTPTTPGASGTAPRTTPSTKAGASATTPGSTQLTPGARNELIERLRKRTGISVERLRKLGLLPAKK